MNDAREAWFAAQPDLDPDRLVFLDETAANTKMIRRYGRAPSGERCRVAVPHGHYKTTTVTAALRSTGLVATALFDGATNGATNSERFRGYVTATLVPVLKPGDTVILDNLPAHKVAGVRDAIESVGARLLYLPPYSPDFNPIEQAFAKFKAELRSAAARTIPDLRAEIQKAFDRVTPSECRNYLAAAGYDYDLAVATGMVTALGWENSQGILSLVGGTRRYVRLDAFSHRKRTGRNPPNPAVKQKDGT